MLYMACIFFASALPTMPLQDRTSLSDKAIHALAYLGLTLVAYRGAAMAPLGRSLDPALQALAVSVLYGIWDEVHQHFVPGRDMELGDWLADVTGAVTATAAIILIRVLIVRGGIWNGRRRERL